MNRLRFGVLAVVLSAVLAIAGCGGRKGAAKVVSSSALGTYPRETVALLVLEIEKVRALRPDTPWLKNMAGLAERDDSPFRDVVRRLGPEVLERLNRLSLAVVPQPGRQMAYGILAEGAFDAAKLREAMGGSDFLTLMETDKVDFSLALLPNGGIALGPKEVLQTMRGNGASRGHGLDSNAAILGPLEKVSPGSQFWGAVDCLSLKSAVKEAPFASSFGGLALNSAAVQSLEAIAFRGMLGDAVDVELFGQADNSGDAKRLADAARGLVALGRVGAGRDQAKEWLAFLDGIRIDQNGADVNLRVSIPAKSMESFVAQMTARPKPTAEPQPAAAAPLALSPSPAPPVKGDSQSLPVPEPSDTQRPSDGGP